MDRAVLFDEIRESRFWGSLDQSQVDGIDGLLDAFATHGDGRPDTLAYGLATAQHETGSRMIPVREGFADNDAEARLRVRDLAEERGPGSAVAEYAQPAGPYGHVYYGRGHVQLTWLTNYEVSSADAGVDLVKSPGSMLDPEVSARILWAGLLDGRWNPHGHGVQHYLDDADARGARWCVNRQDKAGKIETYFDDFLDAIEAAGGVPEVKVKPEPSADPAPDPDDACPTPAPSPARVPWLLRLFGVR